MKNIIILPFLLMISVAFSQTPTMNLITPPSLLKGDTIAIIAPAGILKNRKHIIDKAKKLAQSWGLKVVYGNNLFKQENHFAGTDEERCQDFQDALDNKNIKAIWAARGGYGSVRILDKLDFSKFIENPKWVTGYSDITAFHNHIHNLGIETIHGIMATSLQENPDKIAKSIASLKKILFGEKLSYQISASKYNRNIKNNQKFSGKLIGGNIAILASMLGSDSQLSTENKVLFIEEIGEYKYSIDRMLQSLKRANYFTKVNAVIVGDMTKIKKNSTPWGSAIEQLILEVIPESIPVIFNFPAGHEPDNRALIMGRKIMITTQNRIVSLKFE
ncbi:S66 peptidase family protein [Tenacibaculum piscium]|uniref:LD-carboxypeptidase n=1 Tax=Tenacibaculum piscium TaxID=1458515 RepID=A0A2H1YJM5_9FLAO|nr:LD-carboxypeptidase [Tenacibaculum piscium]MBE7629502.1 LD-carboxypeptidase [Tenacibaculum piscium]MBE7671373.1 LD-carboxypeptidase [Tenacibaculum piscium]SOS75702.1 LD-carboxypeptidase [Tenacibaculum piscium]